MSNKVNFVNIPKELKANASFCVWKIEKRSGKPTKVPYNPRNGQLAKTNDPATFSDFDLSELSYFLQLGTNQSFAWSALETYSKEDYLDSDDDFTYKRNFYSSGKGNIVMKINVNNKVKNSKYDYEETKSGFILVIIENYLAKKVESNQTSVYGNENKFKLEYSYPKALKVTPPEDWESALPSSYKNN